MWRVIPIVAIRADNAEVPLSCLLKHLFFQLAPLLYVHLAESGGEEMDSFDVLGCTIIEELQRGLPRNGYDNVIHISWDHPETGKNLKVADAAAAGANWIYGTRKPGRTQVIHPHGAGFD
jgi:hypothetical protein